MNAIRIIYSINIIFTRLPRALILREATNLTLIFYDNLKDLYFYPIVTLNYF